MRLIYGLSNQPKIDYLKPARHQFRGSRSILFLDQSLATRKSGISTRPFSTLMWNVGVDGVSLVFFFADIMSHVVQKCQLRPAGVQLCKVTHRGASETVTQGCLVVNPVFIDPDEM